MSWSPSERVNYRGHDGWVPDCRTRFMSRFLSTPPKMEKASLYTNNQIRDALNTFMALILVMRNSRVPFCINRLGDNPLEHAFGFGRIRCHDVETMLRLVNGFAGRSLEADMKQLLQIAAAPRRRCSVGVDCDPLQGGPRYIFPSRPQAIARAILARAAITDLDGALPKREARCWDELWRCPPLFQLKDLDYTPPPNTRTALATLSSNQIFRGLMKTPRPAHLISSPAKMGRALTPELTQVHRELERLYGRELTARDLTLQMGAAADRLQIDGPGAGDKAIVLNGQEPIGGNCGI
jgi:hypothetical protein